MLEIPESKTISLQAGNTLINRRIKEVVHATSPHKFAFYCGDPTGYSKLLIGRKVKSTKGHGMFVDIYCDDNICITIGEGTNMRYYSPFEPRPEKHQLLIVFDDGSCVAFTVAMYGGIWVYKGKFDNPYYQLSLNSISPLDETFDDIAGDIDNKWVLVAYNGNELVGSLRLEIMDNSIAYLSRFAVIK